MRADIERECRYSTAGPVFVVGLWRSGTSLLYSLLNQHPQVALLYEGDLSLLWPLFSPLYRPDWLARWDLWNQALTRHQVEPSSIPDGIRDLRAASEAVYRAYAQKKGATISGEKSPNYHDCLVRLAHTFPGSKYILIWRDPADICRSVTRAAMSSPFLARAGTANRVLLGCERFKKQSDQLRRLGVPLYQFHYEDLTLKTEEVMRGICVFLEIEYDPRMAVLDGADRSAIYPGEHHLMVKSAAITTAGARVEVLSPALRKKIERYMRLWRRKYGMEWALLGRLTDAPAGDEPSLWERFWDRLSYRCFRTYDLLIRIAFCFTPPQLWKAYRNLRTRS